MFGTIPNYRILFIIDLSNRENQKEADATSFEKSMYRHFIMFLWGDFGETVRALLIPGHCRD
jgi:hypothetical protein